MSAAVVDRFFAAMTAGDMDAVRSIFHEDCVSTDFATGVVSKGIDANMADVEMWRSSFGDMKVEAVSHTVSGQTVVTEMKFSGTNDGDMGMPDGSSIPATGKRVEMQGCQICEFEGDKMINARQYYDMMAMMAQLGLMPTE